MGVGQMWWVVRIQDQEERSYYGPLGFTHSDARAQAYISVVGMLTGRTPKRDVCLFNKWTGVHQHVSGKERGRGGIDLRVGPPVSGEPSMPAKYRRFVICTLEESEHKGWVPMLADGRLADSNRFGEAIERVHAMKEASLAANGPLAHYVVFDTELGRVLTVGQLETAEAFYGGRCKTLTQANALFGRDWYPSESGGDAAWSTETCGRTKRAA